MTSLLSDFSSSAMTMLSAAASSLTASSSSSSHHHDPSLLTSSSSSPAAEAESMEFWGKVMINYDEMAKKQPKILNKRLQQGIPDSIRGMVWQLMCKGSKSPELEATYKALLTRSSPHEKVIQRDLGRTFPKHTHFAASGPGTGQDSLFNILRAYSMYDPEVGYCQGIAFIAGPLILNMPDEEAFCVLVKLMYDYGFRQIFIPTMAGLDLKLYQFDKLLDEILPNISKHLKDQDIRSNMYASQWFMTIFAYRFPLEMVFRIMDIIFWEGMDAMFRFALALLRRNTDAILSLEFEHLLEFLKIGLFDIYIGNVNVLIQHSNLITISKSKLDKLALQHAEEVRKRDPEIITSDQLRSENKRLDIHIKKLESNYEKLNREHIDLSRDMMEIRDALESSRIERDQLKIQLGALRQLMSEERSKAEAVVKEEMDRLAEKNLSLTARNAELQDALDEAQRGLVSERKKAAEAEAQCRELQKKWDEIKESVKKDEVDAVKLSKADAAAVEE
ncbi:GTPase-activating protein [Phlyctochytrium planicorne]|nr:GTPase-activating protein [Phlyctochytrium planicorne]